MKFSKALATLFGGILLVVALAAVYIGRTATADTEETLYPDPVDRTSFRLRQLQERVEDFRRRRARLPDRLEDLRADSLSSGRGLDALSIDAWGSHVRYERLATGYELRSGGADRQLGTADDVVVNEATRHSHPDVP